MLCGEGKQDSLMNKSERYAMTDRKLEQKGAVFLLNRT